MPVQVPRLNRLQSPGPQSVGRVEVNTPDLVKPMQMESKAAESLGESAIKYFDKVEEDKTNLDVQIAVDKYETTYKDRLVGKDGVKWKDGDPSETFPPFVNEMDNLKKSILESGEGRTPAFKSKLQAKLEAAHSSLTDMKNSVYGNNFNAWDAKATDASVKLRQDALIEASTYLQLPDMTSEVDPAKRQTLEDQAMAPLSMEIDKLKQVRIEQFKRNGLATEDENGNLKISDIGKARLTEDLSKGIENTIGVLNSSGRPDMAEKILNKYSDILDAKTRKDAVKQTTEARFEAESFRQLSNAEKLPIDKREAFVDTIKDEKLKTKVYDLLDTRTRQQKQLKERSQDANFEKLYGYVQKKMMSASPFVDSLSLETDKTFKGFKNKVSPKQLQAMYEMVDKPAKSDEDVHAELMTSLGAGDFLKMPYNTLLESMNGLNEKDKNFFNNQWVKVNTETTSAEMARASKNAGYLEEQAIALKLVKYGGDGKLTNKSKYYLANLKQELYNEFESFPKASVQDQNKMIKQKLAAEVEKNKPGKSWWDSFTDVVAPKKAPVVTPPATGPKASAPPPASMGDDITSVMQLNAPERAGYISEFEKKNNRPPSTSSELLQFINSQRRNKK